jgi:hypothetical protein
MIKTASPQDTFDAIFGAGAMMYSWWINAEYTGIDSAGTIQTKDWTVKVTAENGDGGESTVVIDHKAILKAARQIIKAAPKYASDALVRESRNLIFDADELDFDANSADEILQVLVLGEIVFG